MAEDPKKLTRAHKIALGIISAACCCLIGISAFALAAPDALNQGNLAEATQQTNSASTDYGNDVPQEGQSDEAADQDGSTQDEGDDASGNQGKSTKNESSTKLFQQRLDQQADRQRKLPRYNCKLRRF